MQKMLREPLLSEPDVGLQWLFLKIYTRGFDGADSLVGDLLPPIVAEARAIGVQRWFFMRYMDLHGPHIRMRVLGRRPVLDHLQRLNRELESSLDGVLARSIPTGHVFIAPVNVPMYEGRRGTGIRASIYEPERDKYGGPEGLALAEELFEFSSDLALWACGTLAKAPERAGLAALLLHDAITALLQGPGAADHGRERIGWDEYWEQHLNRWTADLGSRAVPVREKMAQVRAERAEHTKQELLRVRELPAVEAWRRRWRLSMDSYLDKAGKSSSINRSPQHLVFHQSHMMLNRLGFLPREEAVLGIHARHWSE